ncbi:MAG: NYN domain-containing protein [Proteobacteria bacterium]|nr:NYN domain-containing protein [Pseudomonadota bacterium]
MRKNNGREQTLGALLVDLENLYLAVRDEYMDADDLTVSMLQNLRSYLTEERLVLPVVGRAYAPLDYSTSKMFINDLALMGITPVHVLAKPSKNSADLMLAIDCMELLFRREDITTFVIVGGDRDYIPIAERIRENAREVIVVSPRHAMSGDLLTVIGEESYFNPIELLPKEQRVPRIWDRSSIITGPNKEETAGESTKVEDTDIRSRSTDVASPPWRDPSSDKASIPVTMDDVRELAIDNHELDNMKRCANLLHEFRREHRVREIWLTPFLRVMNEAFPTKNNVDRKNLLNRLRDMGAITIIERPRDDEAGTFSVILTNWKHPLIVESNPG